MALKTAAIGILLALMFSGVPAAEDDCSFHDEHLERAINSLIEKLPAERTETREEGSEPPEGFDIIEFKFLGLNSLRPFGPFLTFCRNGSRFVQFDLVNKRPLILVGTIKGNDSNTNELLTRALLVRFTAQFEVEGSGEDVKLHHTVNMPVSMVGLSMLLKTVDKETKEDIGIILNSPRPHFLRTLWHGMLFSELDKLFGEILPKK
uniref:Putative metastriate one of each protein family n=1 Tax=Rhipicephalus pulchellus TaxID=72859 RepID=L7M9W7_RHIPC